MPYRKKLIEVSLPLVSINLAAAEEKAVPRHGHPQALHLWWARRPLAACRAVLWSSLVDDPSEYMPDKDSANEERERLFGIIEELVKWENSNNEDVLEKARLEIARSVARNLHTDAPIGNEAVRDFLATKAPPVLDPFAGGGSIPLEAQRLGLQVYASDLNPVAVLINKALIEFPPNFEDMPPRHPAEPPLLATKRDGNKRQKKNKNMQAALWQREWKGAQGLAEDVRFYGQWMHNEAVKRIGDMYPPVTITEKILQERPDLKERGLKPGHQLHVLAWLWARTITCPSPACQAEMPLVRSFVLQIKKDRQVWIEPIIEKTEKTPKVRFAIQIGKSKAPSGTVNRNGARCVCCGTSVPFEYIREQGKKKKIGQTLMAMFVEGIKDRIILSPNDTQEQIALSINPSNYPETELPEKALGFRVQQYGFSKHSDLFSNRQLSIIGSFASLVNEAFNKIKSDFLLLSNPGWKNNEQVEQYINSLVIYLACALSRLASYNNTFCFWNIKGGSVAQIFTRQTISMSWDFIEINPLAKMSGNWLGGVDWVAETLERLTPGPVGIVAQKDAASTIPFPKGIMVSTDPPYYDNIGYADLSDFFYSWLRLSIGSIFPSLFSTLLVPKSQEIIAAPHRFGGDSLKAKTFFEESLEKAFKSIRDSQNLDYPLTVYYAFKQSETIDEGEQVDMPTASTGWETMLEGLMAADFSIDGTWPLRTERDARLRNLDSNALASSIVLVCRPRSTNAGTVTRREFLSTLKKELSPALHQLQLGSIAPVDLAQAAIGPGMAVFSRYSGVLEANGKPMTVRTALVLINQALDEYLTEQEGEYDSDTRWALAWYEQFGHNEGQFGVADVLSRAKNTSVEGLREAGVVEARAGKVRLYRRDELDTDWDPTKDRRLNSWEAVQHLIHALDTNGEQAAADLLSKLGSVADTARDLAYRLYTVCERKGWAQDALGYNMLVVAWPRLKELSARKPETGQAPLL